MDPIDGLEQAWEQGCALVAALRTQDLDTSTNCAGWRVRDLLNHVLAESLMMTEANRGVAGGNDRGELIGDADPAATFEAVGRDNVASWREVGVDGERTYVYGTFPAPAAVLINLGEVLVHNWDLALATGQECALDPELAKLVFELYDSFPLDGLRAGGQLGPEVPVPAGATMADRMLGLLGRAPLTTHHGSAAAVARAAEAERLRLGGGTLQLLLDASDTRGALSAHRVHLSEGQLAANPHRHNCISEVLFVLDGSIDILAGDRVTTATSGDLVVVPPQTAHAFAASAGCRADVLTMITPGFDRFEFFRALAGATGAAGEGSTAFPAPADDDDDTVPVESMAWSNR